MRIPSSVKTPLLIIAACTLYLGSAIAGTLAFDPMIGAVVSNLLLFVIALVWRRSSRSWRITETRSNSFPSQVAMWLVIILGLILAWWGGQFLAIWAYVTIGSPAYDASTETRLATHVLLALLVSLVLSPVGEEALLRGILYPLMRRHMVPIIAAVLTSGCFALMHGNIVQIAVAFPLGVLLAIVYEITQKLTPVILLHGVFNLFSLAAPVQLVESLASLPAAIVLLSLLGICIALIYPTKVEAAASVKDDAASSQQKT